MFKVVYNIRIGAHTVRDIKKANVYLHSDGAVFDTPEYWPTRELAQVVLDKYQPEHEWVHGDVFKNSAGTHIFLKPRSGDVAINLGHANRCGTPDGQLSDKDVNVKFLFNIKEKL